MSKKRRIHISDDMFRIIAIVFGSVISTAVLMLSIFAITQIKEGNLHNASLYLMGIFFVLGLSRLMNLIHHPTKLNFISFFVMFGINLMLGVLVAFAKDNIYFYDLAGGLFCLNVAISRVFKILEKRTLRSLIFNLLIIVGMIILASGLFIPTPQSRTEDVVLVLCLIIIFFAVIEVIASASSHMRFRVLIKIIVRTYALEIILGLVTMIVAFSLVFTLYEPGIPTFYDGLWYSFAVVTTIGFGDMVAVGPIGRALTVILGLYGIVVVAVFTSIIINFYNETMGKKDASEFKEIEKEENKSKKKK